MEKHIPLRVLIGELRRAIVFLVLRMVSFQVTAADISSTLLFRL